MNCFATTNVESKQNHEIRDIYKMAPIALIVSEKHSRVELVKLY